MGSDMGRSEQQLNVDSARNQKWIVIDGNCAQFEFIHKYIECVADMQTVDFTTPKSIHVELFQGATLDAEG